MVQRSLSASFMPGAYVFPGGRVDPEDRDPAPWAPPDQASARFGGELPEADASAILVAAAREVEEEAFVRLPHLHDLQVWAHWITPEVERKRFDTWFLVAAMPEDATPGHDAQEVIASRWVNAQVAIDRYGDGELLLAPPTFHTLWDLARFPTVAAALAEGAARPVAPVMPRFQQVDERMALLLPGDPLYPSDRPVTFGPTRIVLGEGGRWWLVDGAG